LNVSHPGRSRALPGALAIGSIAALLLVAHVSARQVFRSGARVVPIYASVVGSNGGLLDGLTAADFVITDNGKPQTIALFKHDIEPITISILLDTSPSLFSAATRTTAAVSAFTHRLLPDDRACLGTFSQAVTLNPQLTASSDALLQRLAGAAPWPAGTALWDAIEAGRDALRDEGGRRVVMVVSDGADNSSRIDPDVTRTKLQREGVVIYAIGVRGRFGLDTTEVGALANATGGRLLELKSSDDVAAAMQSVADELHHQYVIGFSPERLDDKLHRLEVKVKTKGATVRARRNYFASKEDVR
jgi:VWFA-related protein